MIFLALTFAKNVEFDDRAIQIGSPAILGK